MADQFRLYELCPSCGGTGLVNWGAGPGQGGTLECPTCVDDPEDEYAVQVYDGKRHVYVGRFEEVEPE